MKVSDHMITMMDRRPKTIRSYKTYRWVRRLNAKQAYRKAKRVRK